MMPRVRLLSIVALFAACSSRPMFVHVGPVPLADADGVVAPEPGPVVQLGPKPDDPMPKVPAGAKVVQIAAARDLPYSQVKALVAAVHAAGATPVLLVGSRGKIMALPHTVDAVPQSILLEAFLEGPEAKACMSPPEALERQCTQRPGSAHVDRAFAREVVRAGVKGFGLTHVHVRPAPNLSWQDAVRAIDAARTCCGPDTKISVSLEEIAL